MALSYLTVILLMCTCVLAALSYFSFVLWFFNIVVTKLYGRLKVVRKDRQREGDVGANVDSHSQRGVAHPTRYPSPLPWSSSLMSPPEVVLARERAELQITLQVTPGEKSYHTGHTNRCEARPSNDAVDTWSECVPVSDCATVHGEESTETYLTKYWTYFTKNCLRRLFSSSFVLSYSSRT